MEFEWDDIKNALNIRKHGISFDEAKEAFFDPLQIVVYDKKNSIDEDRWKLLGMVGWILMLISFTERNGIIRLISARPANKKEMKEYYDGYCAKNSVWS